MVPTMEQHLGGMSGACITSRELTTPFTGVAGAVYSGPPTRHNIMSDDDVSVREAYLMIFPHYRRRNSESVGSSSARVTP
jgi:hypothetical protein